MVHLLSVIASDPEHLPTLLHSLRTVVAPPPMADTEVQSEVWGVGYYGDGQALTIRKPGELLASRTAYELARTVKSRVLLAVVQRGAPGTQNGPPHRFRRWLFGVTGDVGMLETMRGRILEAVPDFVRVELAETGASGLAFAMLLRELHQRNLLGDPAVDGSSVAEALKRTLALMGMLAQEAGIAPPRACMSATNGRTLLVARTQEGPMVFWRRQEGLEAPTGESGIRGDPQKIAEALKRFRAVVFVAGGLAGPLPPGWREVDPQTTLWVDRQLSVNEVHG